MCVGVGRELLEKGDSEPSLPSPSPWGTVHHASTRTCKLLIRTAFEAMDRWCRMRAPSTSPTKADEEWVNRRDTSRTPKGACCTGLVDWPREPAHTMAFTCSEVQLFNN